MNRFRIFYGLIVIIIMIILYYNQLTKSCDDDLSNDLSFACKIIVLKPVNTYGEITLELYGKNYITNESQEYKFENQRVLQINLSKHIEVNDTFIKKEGSSTYIIGKKGYRYLFELRCVENKSYTYTFIDSSSSLWKVPDSVLPNKGSETIYYK